MDPATEEPDYPSTDIRAIACQDLSGPFASPTRRVDGKLAGSSAVILGADVPMRAPGIDSR